MQVITDEYRKLNSELHASNLSYGTSGHLYADEILNLCKKMNNFDVLDYGCGKNTLAHNLPFSIKKYDPSILQFSEDPEPADIVTCTDVMEHIEPELLENVLTHLRSKCKKAVYMTVETVPARKTLADGRNAHINLKSPLEWFNLISEYFTILDYKKCGSLLKFIGMAEEVMIENDPYEKGSTDE